LALVLLGTVVASCAWGAAAAAGPPAWPDLAQQLRAAHVRAGSALAALVAANQDLALLRTAEAHDTLPVPPWLRVWWRKQHPEGRYRDGDPTGGYPLVLKEIYEWMVLHQDLQPGPAEDPTEEMPAKTSVGGEMRIS